MIDFHCHIIPGIDDGAQTLEESLELANQCVEAGVNYVLATPHGSSDDLERQIKLRDEGIAMLQAKINELNLPLTILPGLEYNADGHSDTAAIDTPSCRCGLAEPAKRPLLLELPFAVELDFVSNVLFKAQLKGISMILAHPERYNGFTSKLNMFMTLMDKGLYLQFNAQDFRGGWFSNATPKAMFKLIEHAPDQVLIGSDAHNPNRRPCGFGDAQKRVTQALGEKCWSLMSDITPRRLLDIKD